MCSLIINSNMDIMIYFGMRKNINIITNKYNKNVR